MLDPLTGFALGGGNSASWICRHPAQTLVTAFPAGSAIPAGLGAAAAAAYCMFDKELSAHFIGKVQLRVGN